MKNIILTGTSSGFGLTAVKLLAKAGYTVFATMRNTKTKNSGVAASLIQWAKENEANIHVLDMDVTNDLSVKMAIESIVIKTNGVIDVLINNAGIAFIGLNETLSAEQTNQIFQINVIAVDRMIKAVLPYMHKEKNGLLITISSVAARQHTPVMGTYAASKAAVDALSVSYYYELRSSGIDMAIIQPGAYQTTDIISKQMAPAHPTAENNYGQDITNYKKAVFKYFEPNETSRDPVEVAEVISSLIEMPRGKRPLWTIVGAGTASEVIHNINTGMTQLTNTTLNSRGFQTH